MLYRAANGYDVIDRLSDLNIDVIAVSNHFNGNEVVTPAMAMNGFGYGMGIQPMSSNTFLGRRTFSTSLTNDDGDNFVGPRQINIQARNYSPFIYKNIKTTYPFILGTSYTTIKLDAPLFRGSLYDTDKDGIPDWDEVTIELAGVIGGFDLSSCGDYIINLPTIVQLEEFIRGDETKPYLANSLDRYINLQYATKSSWALLEALMKPILPILSNPADADTDGDGIIDSDDFWGHEFNYYDDDRWAVVKADNRLRRSLPAIDPGKAQEELGQDSEGIKRRRFDIVYSGTLVGSIYISEELQVHSYPGSTNRINIKNALGSRATIEQLVLKTSNTDPEYWFKIRLSTGVHGFIQPSDNSFNAVLNMNRSRIKLYEDDDWVYPFRDNTVVGNRKADEISRGFTSGGHEGVDIHAGRNSDDISYMRLQEYPLFSPVTGTVTQITTYSGSRSTSYGDNDIRNMGIAVRIETYCGNYEVRLLHFEFVPLVKVDDRVTPHTLLGIAGNTGWSTNYHLHMDVAKITKNQNGVIISRNRIDPNEVFEENMRN